MDVGKNSKGPGRLDVAVFFAAVYVRYRSQKLDPWEKPSSPDLNSKSEITCLEVLPVPSLSVPVGYDRSAHQREESR